MLAVLSALVPILTMRAASPAVGIWAGRLKAGAVEVRLVFHVDQMGEKLAATMDSPDQGAKGLPCGEPVFKDGELTIPVPVASGEYKGKLSVDGKKLVGTWSQRGTPFPLDLDKVDSVEGLKRPQTPKPPFPYHVEDVSFINDKGKVTLAGTLTKPNGSGPFPAVVLITGSGPQDRDETVFEHRPFAVIADFLTRRGLAVLRYDDRGVGKSTGDRTNATSLDFAYDAAAAVSFLRMQPDINKKQIGLIGHSEGGLIAPYLAAKDKSIAFVVMMAGTGVPGGPILVGQEVAMAKAQGATKAQIERINTFGAKIVKAIGKSGSVDETKKRLDKALDEIWAAMSTAEQGQTGSLKAFKSTTHQTLLSPWYLEFYRYDPRVALRKVTVPVLALNGTKDFQVDPELNLPEIEKALPAAGNHDVTIKLLPGLNHLFQDANTGMLDEYAKIEQTLSPIFLKALGDWFDKLLKHK